MRRRPAPAGLENQRGAPETLGALAQESRLAVFRAASAPDEVAALEKSSGVSRRDMEGVVRSVTYQARKPAAAHD